MTKYAYAMSYNVSTKNIGGTHMNNRRVNAVVYVATFLTAGFGIENISITYMKNKNIVAVAALVMAALAGVPENLLGVMALLTIAVYISAMVGHKYGVTYGVFIGSMSGIIAVLAYGEYSYALILIVIGCVSGVIRDIGKIPVAVSVIGISYLMGETFLKGVIEPSVYISIGIAMAEEINSITKSKLREFAKGFKI